VRVALLDRDGAAAETAAALQLAGQDTKLLEVRPLPDAPLRLRKIGDRPGHIPSALIALARGGFDVAHAFSAEEATAAVAWSRATRRPAVFTVTRPVERGKLADRRLRLAVVRLAVERSAVVLAPDASVADSVWRWLALRPTVVAPNDADAHVAIYRGLGRR
jgi:Glycosyltransferase Family 4